ncbi:hypothetical protein, partial [Rhodosalinus sediminis]|uniref:hypothetical protein n=1 Tax=Rhodosalinus sediminis TaxID=1940533 RepID=UPI002352B39C
VEGQVVEEMPGVLQTFGQRSAMGRRWTPAPPPGAPRVHRFDLSTGPVDRVAAGLHPTRNAALAFSIISARRRDVRPFRPAGIS